jgi:hypothetical protein
MALASTSSHRAIGCLNGESRSDGSFFDSDHFWRSSNSDSSTEQETQRSKHNDSIGLEESGGLLQ